MREREYSHRSPVQECLVVGLVYAKLQSSDFCHCEGKRQGKEMEEARQVGNTWEGFKDDPIPPRQLYVYSTFHPQRPFHVLYMNKSNRNIQMKNA